MTAPEHTESVGGHAAVPVGPAAELQQVWRSERTAVLGSVARRLGDLQLAEDAVQEAFVAAAQRWPVDGVPARPGAWLTTTAWRKALDMVRKERFPVREGPDNDLRAAAVAARVDPRLEADPREADVRDDVLSLVLTCCHPALASEAQVALTLRHVIGLTDAQIAARFLVAEATMSKRLVRARAKIRDARIPFGLPDRTRVHERLGEVRTVVYLIFTEGHLSSGAGPPVSAELCEEALWLARELHRLVPNDAETTGLLALLLLLHSRAPARTDPAGRLVPYDEQDRSLWDTTLVTEAKQLLRSTGRARPGPYQLEAAIALLHAVAPEGRVDWAAVAGLYRALARAAPSPVVDINLAVALCRAEGPRAGLAHLAGPLTDPRVARYAPLHATHADLLERARDQGAAKAWERAVALADDPAQQAELRRRWTAATVVLARADDGPRTDPLP